MDRDRLKEFLHVPEDVLSLKAAMDAEFQAPNTDLRGVTFNIPLIRKKLTHLDSQIMNEFLEELDMALSDAFHVTEGTYMHGPGFLTHVLIVDWCPYITYDTTLDIVGRMINRVFVGLPLCTIQIRI